VAEVQRGWLALGSFFFGTQRTYASHDVALAQSAQLGGPRWTRHDIICSGSSKAKSQKKSGRVSSPAGTFDAQSRGRRPEESAGSAEGQTNHVASCSPGSPRFEARPAFPPPAGQAAQLSPAVLEIRMFSRRHVSRVRCQNSR